MKQIDFKVAGKKYEYQVPERWEEVTAEQFRAYVDVGEFCIDMVRRVMDLDDVVAVNLTAPEWWWLKNQFEWMRETEGVGKLFIDKIALPDGTLCYGYNSDFSDVTWEEWMYADTYASKDRWDVVTAVLYRPERKDWDHESDRRIPFTKFGASERTKQTSQFDKLTLDSIKANYLLLRKRMTDHFYHIFVESVPDNEEKPSAQKAGPTDWLTIIRNIMGDNFFEERKYFELSVPSVLFQLEAKVKDYQKHGK